MASTPNTNAMLYSTLGNNIYIYIVQIYIVPHNINGYIVDLSPLPEPAQTHMTMSDIQLRPADGNSTLLVPFCLAEIVTKTRVPLLSLLDNCQKR